MAMASATAASAPAPLEPGDHLTRDEFERRYAAMPGTRKAELIEGIVYMPSPVSHDDHGNPHFRMATWLGVYASRTPGVQGSDNATVRLDLDNEPQPDLFLRILPDRGGQSRDEAGYVAGAPELIVEVAASRASYDLHPKLNAYRRNGVREYVVWRVRDRALDWFVLREGRYDPLECEDGVCRSVAFPGLWLHPAALLGGDDARVLDVVLQGTASPEHGAFVARLSARRTG